MIRRQTCPSLIADAQVDQPGAVEAERELEDRVVILHGMAAHGGMMIFETLGRLGGPMADFPEPRLSNPARAKSAAIENRR